MVYLVFKSYFSFRVKFSVVYANVSVIYTVRKLIRPAKVSNTVYIIIQV